MLFVVVCDWFIDDVVGSCIWVGVGIGIIWGFVYFLGCMLLGIYV